MSEIHTVRVFVDQNNNFGNPVGIVFDEGKKIDKGERQKIAAEVGYSETVFVDGLNPVKVSIFNPHEEISFSGYALLGVAWLINKKHPHQFVNLL